MSIAMRGRTNGFMVTVAMQADLSRPVIEKMGWEGVLLNDEPTPGESPDERAQRKGSRAAAFREGWTEISLDGELAAEKFVLSPNGEMAKWEVELTADSISSFHAIKTDGEDGKATKYSLTFKLQTSADLAEAKLGRYWRALGTAGAALKVGFTEQAELDLEAAESAEPAEASGPTLASAREMTAPRGRKAN